METEKLEEEVLTFNELVNQKKKEMSSVATTLVTTITTTTPRTKEKTYPKWNEALRNVKNVRLILAKFYWIKLRNF